MPSTAVNKNRYFIVRRPNLKTRLYFGNYLLEFPDDIIPHWSMAKMRLAASLRYAARRTGIGIVL